MTRSILGSLLVAALAQPVAGQTTRIDGPIFVADAPLRTLYDAGTFTEGVAVAPDGAVWS